MKLRSILHCDMNCFYANVEQHRNPSLRGLPIAVAGDPEKRNGVILTKSREAKACGVKTAETIWQAKQKCPELIIVPPDYPAYLRYSRLARQIYYQYTNQVEPFGLDESWLDITGSLALFGNNPLLIAKEISERIKSELGLTVSVGVSWNKVFAKFGSDMDPGDGVIEITPENYQEVVWPHPVDELIYVGSATKRKLHSSCVDTIGDLANASDYMLQNRLGKMGTILKTFANGQDESSVKVMNPKKADVDYAIKSIGNSLTAPHDIVDAQTAKALIYLLSESVAQRLRECRMRAKTVVISVRDAQLASYSRQTSLAMPSHITDEIASTAFSLLASNEPLDEDHPVRALGVRAVNLVSVYDPIQQDLFGDVEKRAQKERLDKTIDILRHRFGNTIVRRMVEISDETMANLDIKRDNTIHPVGFFCE